MHSMLLDTLLTQAAAKSYAAMLRSFPFPPSWPRVQGPLHHLKSYSLSEHARWSVVVPVLLRCWLKEKHIRPYLVQMLRKDQTQTPVHHIIQCFAAAATSNCVLMGDFISETDRSNMDSIVSHHRLRFQRLLQLVADSIAADPRRARSRSVSVDPSSLTSPLIMPEMPATAQSQAADTSGPKELAALAQTYLNSMRLPNVHVAVHYLALAEEYAIPANCNVLIGEDKHRHFKKVIYTTNHQHPERDLLHKENIRQTLRLILTNSFSHEPTITRVVKEIFAVCPLLFSTLLPRSEQMDLEGSLISQNDDDDDEDVQPDSRHSQPGCIKAKYCKEVLALPTRVSHLTAAFRNLLCLQKLTCKGVWRALRDAQHHRVQSWSFPVV